ncbi:MAG: hypothetical protein AAGA70_18620 [Pseudomonadota bacterium]
MDRYEYKVIEAPEKGLKAKGIKQPGARFAHAVEVAMNQLGLDGWEYWRAERLPSTERAGLTGSKQIERHLLVFRRPQLERALTAPILTPVPDPTLAPVPEPMPAPEPAPEVETERRMPVFTRRLEMAREQRREALGQSDEDATHVRPVNED